MASRKTHIKRLTALRDLLLTVKKHNYDHSSYKCEIDSKSGCGTTACALGHAVNNKKLFPKLNLHFVPVDDSFDGKQFFDIETTNSYRAVDFAADEYFGPGAYEAIFDADSPIASFSEYAENVDPRIAAKVVEIYALRQFNAVI